jgi:hypothetical protein
MSKLFASLRPKHLFLVVSLVTVLLALLISSFVYTSAHAATPRLSMQFTCAQAVDHRSGAVCVHTQARAALTIKIWYYCSKHYATSKSLQGTQNADAHGNHTWSWVPDTKCKGPATAHVTEIYEKHTSTVSKGFSVK